ncbi:MAG: hypothetical protein A2Y78_06740 [Acidobacteria bacterium RBG_13_68_16]|nr:MAG: hypothetical protein A2Y78_06740 [Acidobacteria bacterium RBG_13_68_16]
MTDATVIVLGVITVVHIAVALPIISHLARRVEALEEKVRPRNRRKIVSDSEWSVEIEDFRGTAEDFARIMQVCKASAEGGVK